MTAEHHAMLRDSVEDFTTRETDMARVRRMRADGSECDRTLWRRMGELGWLGILVPEDCGGLGLGMAEAAIVAEGLGRALVPEPFNASAILAASTLALSGKGALRDGLLAKAVAGDLLISLAWQERAAQLDPSEIAAVATEFEGGYRLQGTKRYLAGAASADGFVVSANCGGEPALFWVPRDAAGVELKCESLPDGRQSGTLTLTDVSAARDQRLAAGRTAVTALETALDRATALTGAELLGVMSRSLDMSVEYMRTRVQFGKPIGSFQALQHRAVDLYVQQQLSSALLDDGLRQFDRLDAAAARSALASRIKSRCADAALRITQEAIQFHGAIGFTDECDVGLFLKRAMVLSAWLGNPALHRRRYARLALEATA